MGRQINFYMSNEVRQSFCEFLKQEDFLLVTSKNFKESENIFLDDAKDEFMVCLYKKEYGEVNSIQVPNSNMLYIDRINSPIIVFKVPNVDDEKRKVFSGKLWLTSVDLTQRNRTTGQPIIRQTTDRLIWGGLLLIYSLLH